jgi:gamma-glutamyltranspeptidase/glutathione hydrolase
MGPETMMEPFNSLRAPVYAKNGLACSSQPLAAALGGEILRAGGNAADAAVAMAAMVNITEPMMNGLGGDCMMLVHWNGEFCGLNASGRSGSRLTIDNLRAAGFSFMPQAGGATVTVPGALDGYLALYERFGSMDLSALVEPAAAYAEDGFAVGAKISHAWKWGASKLQRFSGDASPFLPGGGAPKAGQIFQQKDLASTWRSIGKVGRAAFYGPRFETASSAPCKRPEATWKSRTLIRCRRRSGSSQSAPATVATPSWSSPQMAKAS